MEINFYFDDSKQLLYLFSADGYSEGLIDKISIDINNHDAKNVYSFFQKRLLELLLKEEKEELTINKVTIEDKEFYGQEPFAKLLELFDEIIDKINDTVAKCFETSEESVSNDEELN